MANNFFKFKQFVINQEKTAMKVGTDGVLLGAWADCLDKKNILDIGAGTGLISLMLAQRNENAKIHAIEIEKEASCQAKENIDNSIWENRISVENISFQKFYENTNEKYDLIVSNPPYFINSLKNPKKEKTLARHSDFLPYEEIILGSSKILNEKGLLSVILPINESLLFVKLAEEKSLFCIRKTEIKPNYNKTSKRLLLEFSFEKKETKTDILTIETDQRHSYTEEYKRLTKDFYLAF